MPKKLGFLNFLQTFLDLWIIGDRLPHEQASYEKLELLALYTHLGTRIFKEKTKS